MTSSPALAALAGILACLLGRKPEQLFTYPPHCAPWGPLTRFPRESWGLDYPIILTRQHCFHMAYCTTKKSSATPEPPEASVTFVWVRDLTLPAASEPSSKESHPRLSPSGQGAPLCCSFRGPIPIGHLLVPSLKAKRSTHPIHSMLEERNL